jgi:hypothetical protein
VQGKVEDFSSLEQGLNETIEWYREYLDTHVWDTQSLNTVLLPKLTQ